ncbi:MAG: T9SS C-terminal target domain-containing protein [Ignavibacteriae bacterium]|nr:MAG: T9SS C-terminal target domain-containing protein [Ignavibacteriota bacterium]
MKNLFSFKSLLVLLIGGTLTLLFQASDSPKTEADNPYLDQPPPSVIRDAAIPRTPEPFAVITNNGYDNWDLGVDFMEQHISANMRAPNNFFTCSNINTGHYTLNGENWTTWYPVVPNSAGDPWTAADSNGTLFYQTMKSPVTGTWVIKSSDNGVTWTTAVSGVNGVDRNTMAIDQTNGPYAGYIYQAMTGSGSAYFARSTDHGASFQQTYNGSPHNLPGVHIAVGPNGTIQGGCVWLVTYSGSNNNGTYTFHRSTNGGLNFQVVSSLSGIGTIGLEISSRGTVNGARCRAYPWIACDNSYGPYRGRLYLVYSGNNPPGSGNKSDVFLRYSTDQGLSWSPITVVNDNPNPTLTHQWFSSIWCEKTTGKLYINWYDMRNDPNNQLVDVYATYTTTGGTSFVPNQRVTNQSWVYPGGSCGAPCYKGDYHMIAANSKTSMSVWFDGRNSGQANTYVGYFPDFALTAIPSAHTIQASNDSDFTWVSIPSTKLYTDVAKFTATVTPTPGAGTIALSFLNKTTPVLKDSINTFPDSLRLRIKTSGGVTSGSYTIKVTGAGSNGTPIHVRSIALTVNPVGLTINNTEVPEKFYLYQNFPNPFNPSTTVRFDLAKSGMVKLNVYDVTGKLVSALINDNYYAGQYSVDFNASGLSSGIYFYKLETADFTSIKKMILVK